MADGSQSKRDLIVSFLFTQSIQAGLIVLDGPMTIDDANDHTFVSRSIENAIPFWPPGTRTGYHAITFGWLVDQLIRRVDPQHRSAAQFYREEIQSLSSGSLFKDSSN